MVSIFQFIHFLQRMQVDLEAAKFKLISESPSNRQTKYVVADEELEIAKKSRKWECTYFVIS